jgi:N6-adenosine-specific RNA methylase IME4
MSKRTERVLGQVIDRDLKKGAKKIEKAGVIYADPAWQTVTYSGVALPQRADEPHYPTMSLDDLAALPVGDLAADDCCLFMWIIGSHVDQGIRLAEKWGFKYNTDVFIWRKITKAGFKHCTVEPLAFEELGSDKWAKMSMGKWSRKQSETCYLFTRGKPSPKEGSRSVRQIIDAPIREHSRKPDEAYERIETLASGPYVELFSRTTRPGWSVWGNDVGKFDAKKKRSKAELLA